MTDILQHWKESRFIVAGKELTDNECLVVLTDVSYWAEHMGTLSAWCRSRDAVISGMTVIFDSEKTLLEFVLKWS
jgi:hypothetical protein